jgi:hypothetical protein
MNVHQHAGATLLLYAFHQVIRRLRLQQSRHVLDANGIAAYFLQALRHLSKRRHGVQRADRIRDRALRMLARLLHCINTSLEIAHVVESVEYAEHVHPVLDRLLYESLDYSIFVVSVPEQILATQ